MKNLDSKNMRIMTAEEFYKENPKRKEEDLRNGFRWGKESKVMIKEI